MIDKKAYENLVDEISVSWKPIIKPSMKWYPTCKQINLWTYWQGINVKKHCGAMGVNINRKKFVAADYPELANKTGMELMRGDWSRISGDVKRLGICSKILAEKD